MKLSDLVKAFQRAANSAGEKIDIDGQWGPETQSVADRCIGTELTLKIKAPPPLDAPLNLPPAAPWLEEAKKFAGKNENDPEFNKFMSSKWSLLGLNLGTISKNWAAWCGLAVAVSLAGVGLKVQKDGAAARNWDKYGIEINWKKDGIPRGAIVRINHVSNCSSGANNHVTMSDGDCAPSDLLIPGASFNGYGGNQSNQWKVSTFPVAHICAVRWPSESAKPPPILKSHGCNGKPGQSESTR